MEPVERKDKIRDIPPKRIIVIGAGQIGMHLVSSLSNDGFNVILIDEDETIKETAEAQDVSFLTGHGCDPGILQKIKFNEEDMTIAVTNSDEVNLLACHFVKQMGCPTTIARVYQSFYSDNDCSSLNQEYWKKYGIDILFNQTLIATKEIENLIENPGTIDTISLQGAKLQINAYRVKDASPLTGKRLVGLQHVKKFNNMLVAAVTTNNTRLADKKENEKKGLFSFLSNTSPATSGISSKTIIPRGDYVIKNGDLLYISGNKENFKNIGEMFDPSIKKSFKHIFILGGGYFSEKLADDLVQKFRKTNVYLLNSDRKRAYHNSDFNHNRLIVLNNSFDDMDTLKNEGLDEDCIFIGASNDEKDNIMASLMVKENTGARTIALIQDTQYMRLLPYLEIDASVVPKHLLAEKLLRIFHYNVYDVLSAIGDNVELLEFIVKKNGHANGMSIVECNIPKDSNIVGVFRDGEFIAPKGNTILQENDHIIMFALRSVIDEIDQIF